MGDELRASGEGLPHAVVAHVTFDWPTWSQTAYRRWYLDEVFDEAPAIEMEIVFRVQRLKGVPDPDPYLAILPPQSPAIGAETMERAAPTVEIQYDDTEATSHAIEVTYEGLYELAEETLADGSEPPARRALRQALGSGSRRCWCAWATWASSTCRPTRRRNTGFADRTPASPIGESARPARLDLVVHHGVDGASQFVGAVRS